MEKEMIGAAELLDLAEAIHDLMRKVGKVDPAKKYLMVNVRIGSVPALDSPWVTWIISFERCAADA